MSRSRSAPYHAVTRDFLEDFATAVQGVVVHPKPVVAWLVGRSLNALEPLRWLWPSASQPRAPRVVRLSLNHNTFTPPKTLLRRFGFPPLREQGYLRCLTVEWSAMEHELPEFATWLPRWIQGRLDPTLEIPVPPHPSHVFSGGLRTTNYAWTATAWDAYGRWRGEPVRVPWYATHASKVVPAAPEAPTTTLAATAAALDLPDAIDAPDALDASAES